MLDLDINKIKKLPFKEIMEIINANHGFFYNKNVKGYEFPESGVGSDIHKEIETILSKDITKHASGGLAHMVGE